jgi:predicted nucleotidyltransferase
MSKNLSKSIDKFVGELTREQQVALYEKLQEQLFIKPVVTTPFTFKKMLQGVESNPMIEKIHHYLKNKPIVRAYFFGDFTHDEHGVTTIDLLLDLEQGVSHFEVLVILEGLENLLDKSVKLISNRVALIRLPYLD